MFPKWLSLDWMFAHILANMYFFKEIRRSFSKTLFIMFSTDQAEEDVCLHPCTRGVFLLVPGLKRTPLKSTRRENHFSQFTAPLQEKMDPPDVEKNSESGSRTPVSTVRA